jgi:hypothetical protein
VGGGGAASTCPESCSVASLFPDMRSSRSPSPDPPPTPSLPTASGGREDFAAVERLSPPPTKLRGGAGVGGGRAASRVPEVRSNASPSPEPPPTPALPTASGGREDAGAVDPLSLPPRSGGEGQGWGVVEPPPRARRAAQSPRFFRICAPRARPVRNRPPPQPSPPQAGGMRTLQRWSGSPSPHKVAGRGRGGGWWSRLEVAGSPFERLALSGTAPHPNPPHRKRGEGGSRSGRPALPPPTKVAGRGRGGGWRRCLDRAGSPFERLALSGPAPTPALPTASGGREKADRASEPRRTTPRDTHHRLARPAGLRLMAAWHSTTASSSSISARR